MPSVTCMTLKQNGRERDEKMNAVHSILPGDVISVTERGQTEGRDDGETKKFETNADRERNETDGLMQKSCGFEMHSTYFKTTGIEP